jgi:hypothetical protein
MRLRLPPICLCQLAALALATGCQVAAAFPFRDAADGVSCRHFDVALGQLWPDGGARWVDAAGAAQGARAFDTQSVELRGGKPTVRWNITALVRGWASGSFPNEGLLLAGTGPAAGGVQFHARDSTDVGLRPSLQVTYLSGGSELLSAAADADLECSTHAGTGPAAVLNVGPKTVTVMRFDLTRLRKGRATDVKSAELILVRTPTAAWAAGTLAVFRLSTPYSEALPAVQSGLAAAYPGDRGIDKHPDVLFVDRFEAVQLDSKWTVGDKEVRLLLEPMPAQPPGPGAEPPSAAALPAIAPYSLRGVVPAGKNTGMDLRYDFKKRGQAEPDEVYMRYYLRLGREWRTMGDTGKLPGLSGTYGKVAWGGRGWDGQLGWSARGSFRKAPSVDHPMFGRVALASYVYHSKADAGGYGEIVTWGGAQGAAFIETERWVCVEQFLKLNTPGQEDGVLKAWVDGRLVYERNNFRFRDNPQVKIENAWMDLYYGGPNPSPRNYSMHIDNVVIAKSYIGPMAAAPGRP